MDVHPFFRPASSRATGFHIIQPQPVPQGLHWTMDHPAVGRVVKGQFKVRQGGAEWVALTGDWFVLPRHLDCHIASVSRTPGDTIHVLSFHSQLIERFCSQYTSLLHSLGDEAPPPSDTLDRATEAAWVRAEQHVEGHHSEDLKAAVAVELLLRIAEKGRFAPLFIPGWKSLATEVAFLVKAQPRRPLTIGEAARLFAMSESTFRRRLEREGHTFRDLVESVRLDCARRLLLERRISISAVAEHCGFSSPSHFTQRFKMHFGVLPKDLQRGATRLQRAPSSSAPAHPQ